MVRFGTLCFGSAGGDPWREAIEVARGIRCPALVIDTSAEDVPRLPELARALGAEPRLLDSLDRSEMLNLRRR